VSDLSATVEAVDGVCHFSVPVLLPVPQLAGTDGHLCLSAARALLSVSQSAVIRHGNAFRAPPRLVHTATAVEFRAARSCFRSFPYFAHNSHVHGSR